MTLGLPIVAAGWALPATQQSHRVLNNSVARFLSGAERQTETDAQRRQVQLALQDMLNRSPRQLQKLRYADYSGTPNAWSLIELLQHYFVPKVATALADERFYKDVNAPAARVAIQQQLKRVNHSDEP